jgi:drug/metabolite transporter superfamily protein YnfA
MKEEQKRDKHMKIAAETMLMSVVLLGLSVVFGYLIKNRTLGIVFAAGALVFVIVSRLYGWGFTGKYKKEEP